VWVECPTELDAPILILGFEAEDLGAICGVMLFTGLFLFEGLPPVFLVTAAFGVLLRRFKKGRAPGALIHLLHRWDLLRIPGVLPVRASSYSAVAGSFDAD
jgi:hypothetical protein